MPSFRLPWCVNYVREHITVYYLIRTWSENLDFFRLGPASNPMMRNWNYVRPSKLRELFQIDWNQNSKSFKVKLLLVGSVTLVSPVLSKATRIQNTDPNLWIYLWSLAFKKNVENSSIIPLQVKKIRTEKYVLLSSCFVLFILPSYHVWCICNIFQFWSLTQIKFWWVLKYLQIWIIFF